MKELAGSVLRQDAHRAVAGFCVVVKRNGSTTPASPMLVVVAIAAFSFAVGITFAWLGLWLVLPFVGLEVVALALAFGVYARHVADNEIIRTDEDGLAVEIREGNRLRHYRLDAHWARCIVESAGRDARLMIGSHGRFVQIGRCLNEDGRRQLRNVLNDRLREYRAIRN